MSSVRQQAAYAHSRKSISATIEDMRKLAKSAGLENWGYKERNGLIMLEFEHDSICYRITHTDASDDQKESARRWRVIYYIFKHDLLAVQEGIEKIQERFFRHIVNLNGQTIYEASLPMLERLREEQRALPPGEENKR